MTHPLSLLHLTQLTVLTIWAGAPARCPLIAVKLNGATAAQNPCQHNCRNSNRCMITINVATAMQCVTRHVTKLQLQKTICVVQGQCGRSLPGVRSFDTALSNLHSSSFPILVGKFSTSFLAEIFFIPTDFWSEVYFQNTAYLILRSNHVRQISRHAMRHSYNDIEPLSKFNYRVFSPVSAGIKSFKKLK